MDKFKYRAVIEFLHLKGCSPADIQEEMHSVYGISCPSRSSIYFWIAEFKRGRTSISNEPVTGRPPTEIVSENVDLVEKIVLSDRRLKLKEIAEESGLSKTTVYRIIKEHLGMNKISARWIPKLLSAVQKEQRMKCAQSFLNLCADHPQSIFDRIVTGDETMVLYFDPTSKRESMEWRRPDEERPKKAKVQQSRRKIMSTIFWDNEGILLIDFKTEGTTVNGTYYADLLRKLRVAIKEKRRGKLSKGVLLLHDNAPVHTAAIAKAAVLECGFEEISHPPYSPDMAPSDYYLFPKLKKDLRGRRFDDECELKNAVLEHFQGKSLEYYQTGISALYQKCEKCIKVQGSYIEK